MTELGMVLSNTLDHRVPGHVGEPMPGVEVRLVDDAGVDVPDGAARRAAGARPAGVRRATGSGPTPPPRRSSTAGSAPATSPSTSPAATACSAGRRSTSSRPAARRCRRWRSRRSTGPIRTSPTAPSSASTTSSGASGSPSPPSPAPGAAPDGDDAAGVGQAATRRGQGPDPLHVRRRPPPQHPRQGRQARGRQAVPLNWEARSASAAGR